MFFSLGFIPAVFKPAVTYSLVIPFLCLFGFWLQAFCQCFGVFASSSVIHYFRSLKCLVPATQKQLAFQKDTSLNQLRTTSEATVVIQWSWYLCPKGDVRFSGSLSSFCSQRQKQAPPGSDLYFLIPGVKGTKHNENNWNNSKGRRKN